MKARMALFLGLLILAESAIASVDDNNDKLGVYFDSGTFAQNCSAPVQGANYHIYFVLKNCTAPNVDAVAFQWRIPNNTDPVVGFTFPNGGFIYQGNIRSCVIGYLTPLPSGGQPILLADVTLRSVTSNPDYIQVGPASPEVGFGNHAVYSSGSGIVYMTFEGVGCGAVNIDGNGWSDPGVARLGCPGPDCAVQPATITWADLQTSSTTDVCGQGIIDAIRGQVEIPDLTNLPGPTPGLTAEVGYGDEGGDIQTWGWLPATWIGDVNGRDEYALPAGTRMLDGGFRQFRTCIRFSHLGGPYTYGDLDGSANGYSSDLAGVVWGMSVPSSATLLGPPSMDAVVGQPTGTMTARVDFCGTPEPWGFNAEFGYGPRGSIPGEESWRWSNANFTVSDAVYYTGTVTSDSIGQYDYCFRIHGWGGPVYGLLGNDQCGQLNVDLPCQSYVGGVAIPDSARAIAVSSSYAYVGTGGAGSFQVVDIANPGSPQIVGSLGMSQPVLDVAVAGEVAYALTYDRLCIIDISHPIGPRILRTVFENELFAGLPAVMGGKDLVAMTRCGQYVVVANAGNALVQVDVTDPSTPQDLHYWWWLSEDFSVIDRQIALASFNDRVDWYSRDPRSGGSNLMNVRFVDQSLVVDRDWVSDDGSFGAIAMASSVSFHCIVGTSSEFRVLGHAGSSNKGWRGCLAFPGSMLEDVCLWGTHAYVADRGIGVRDIDVSNPDNPSYAGRFCAPGGAYGVAVFGEYVYAVGDSGLSIFHATGNAPAPTPEPVAAMTQLRANFPNPFNPSTTIEYQLSTPGRVRLRIYDMSGRMVRTLVDADLDAGPHRAAWNGFDEHGMQAPAGVYLYRLEAGAHRETRRMTLLK